MEREWWVVFLQWTLWGIVMTLLMRWMAKSRLRQRPESELHTLRHPPSTLVMGVIGAVFFFGIAVVSNTVGKNESTSIWTTLSFAGFGLLSTTMIADYFFSRHSVSEKGIEYGSMLGRRGSLPWSEVTQVRYAPSMKWFVLEASSGRTVRVSAMLLGLPEFAHFVLTRTAEGVIAPGARDLLSETAQGRPPSVWV